jgi:hypothetical protein
LNGAVTILGNEALLYLSESPEIMKGLLSTIAAVCVESRDKLTGKFDPQAADSREMFIGNCPVLMISPQTYSEVVLPADRRLRNRFKMFGLHHCGPMDRYLEAYKELEPLEFVEAGWGSNVAAVRRAFPNAKFDSMISIFDLENMTQPAVRELIVNMFRKTGSLSRLRDVWVADIGPEVPYETVLDFVEAVDLPAHEM